MSEGGNPPVAEEHFLNVWLICFKHPLSKTSLQEKDEAKKRRIDDAIARCEVPKSVSDFKWNEGNHFNKHLEPKLFSEIVNQVQFMIVAQFACSFDHILRPGPNPSRFLGAKTSGRCGAWF